MALLLLSWSSPLVAFQPSDVLFRQAYHGDDPLAHDGRGATLVNAGKLKLEEWGLPFGEGYAAPVIAVAGWDGRQGTLACWVKPVDWDYTHKKAVIIARPYKPEDGGFLFYKYDSAETLYFYTAEQLGGGRSKSGVVLNYHGLKDWKKGEWHHVALAWKRGALARLYVDGRLAVQREGAFQFPKSMAGIEVSTGDRTSGWGCSAKTFMRDLYLFGRPLLDSEVALLASRHPRRKTVVPATPSSATVIPIGLAAAAPTVDGAIGDGEYACEMPGLVDTGTHTLHPGRAVTYTAHTKSHLHLAVSVDLPEGHEPTVLATGRDDEVQIAKGDLVCVFLRKDHDLAAKTYEGWYVTVDPKGHVFDAYEEISWDKLYCHRHAERDLDVEAASRVVGRVWTVELSVPLDQLSIEDRRQPLALSLGVKLGGRRLALVDHPNWFDHNEAFVHAMLGPVGVRLKLGDVHRGRVAPTCRVRNASAEPVKGTIRYRLSVPTVEQIVSGMVFDMAVGERTTLTAGKTAGATTQPFALAPGKHADLQCTLAVTKPDTYLLQTELRLGALPVLRRRFPFTYYAPLVVELRPAPSRDLIRAATSIYGLDGAGARRVRFVFRTKAGQEALRAEFPVERREHVFEISMAKLQPGRYDVEGSLLDGKGRSAAKTVQTFEKWDVPTWLREPKGVEALKPDWVPAPWTPLEVTGADVACWGRRFAFGQGGLVDRITSQGQELLTAPAAVHYEREGKRTSFKWQATRVESAHRGLVTVVQEARAPGFTLVCKHHIEFDGMDRVDVTIRPEGRANVDRLWIEVPLRGVRFMYDYASDSRAWMAGLVSDRTWQRAQHIWLGNDRVGLTWFVENYKGWLVNSTKPRITLSSRGDTAVLRLLVVNEPSEIAGPLELTFGLHPTPVKPFFDGWRAIRPQGWAWTPPPTNLVMWGPTSWNSTYCKPAPRTWQVLEDLLAYARKRGQRSYPYLTPFTISSYDMVQRDYPFLEPGKRFPDDVLHRSKRESRRTEEYWYFAEDWHIEPVYVTYGSKGEASEIVTCSAASSWADYFVGSVHEILARSDLDGFYFDLANPRTNFDPSRGYAYRTKDGRLEGTVDIFASRALYKRLHALFDTMRGPKRKPYILGHGMPSFSPLASFWDVCFHGEEFKPKGWYDYSQWFRQERVTGNPIASAPAPDAPRSVDGLPYRAMFGRQFGMPIMFLPQYGHNVKLYKLPFSREVLAFTSVHNNYLWPAYVPPAPIYEFWKKVEIPFGMGDTEFHPYWENDIRSTPASVRVSFWKKRGKERYLLAAANWSEKPVDATIALPAPLAGLGGRTDPETGTAAAAGATWQVHIPAHDLRVLFLGE